jgi:hypothetical protein
MKISRKVRELAKTSLHRLFETGQRLGVDILPRHFYSSIPDVHHLKTTSYWKQPLSMTGIAGAELPAQLAFLEGCCTEALRARVQKGDIFAHACAENGEEGFGATEAAVLFCFISTKRPKRVVQVGAGVSTAVILLAAQEAGYPVDVVCIDPFPSRYLVEMARAGKITLLSEMAQTVRLDALTAVGEGDLFFVDSTHTVQPGGEVNRIIFEVLPRLSAGTHVHFHDIHFPYDYPRVLLDSLFFPMESTLLYAFLVQNAHYVLSASLSMLHYAHPAELARLVPGYRPQANDEGLRASDQGHFPSSTYLRVVG